MNLCWSLVCIQPWDYVDVSGRADGSLKRGAVTTEYKRVPMVKREVIYFEENSMRPTDNGKTSKLDTIHLPMVYCSIMGATRLRSNRLAIVRHHRRNCNMLSAGVQQVPVNSMILRRVSIPSQRISCKCNDNGFPAWTELKVCQGVRSK